MARNPNTLVVVLVAIATVLHSSAARPAPQPTSSTPPLIVVPDSAPAPAPAPATGAVTYTVGDTIGWTIPSNGASSYVNWASGKTFKVGDILVFNYQNSAHNVEQVTKEKYISCSSVTPLATYNNPPVRVTLDKSGAYYFLCGVPGHCFAGQKLAINVTGNAASPSSATAPPSTSTTPSSPSPAGATLESSGAASHVSSLGFATLLFVAAAFIY